MRKIFTSKKHTKLSTTAMGASNDLVKKYDDIIDLSLGDVDFKTPELVIRKAMEDALLGHTHYTDFLGDKELRKEISKFYKKQFNININLEEIMVTTSGCHGMWLVLESILDDEDEVIIHEPFFTPYSYQIMLAHGKPIYLPTYEEENFEISPVRLEKLITKKTKAVIINTPNNPTGTCFQIRTLERVLELALKYNFVIIADDVYTTFSFKKPFIPMISLDKGKDRIITINSFSKNYAMTGWRIGNVIAPKSIIEVMKNINENNVFTAPSVSQRAALYALKFHETINPPIVNEIKNRLYYAYERIHKMSKITCLEPKGSMYLFPNIKETGCSSEEVCKRLLDEAHVLALPGNAFGNSGEGYIRLAMSVGPLELKKAFDRIEKTSIFR